MTMFKKTMLVAAALFAVGAAVPAMAQMPVPAKTVTTGKDLQDLRTARKELNEAKATFDKDPTRFPGHRQEILEGIDKAINAIDSEVTIAKAKK